MHLFNRQSKNKADRMVKQAKTKTRKAVQQLTDFGLLAHVCILAPQPTTVHCNKVIKNVLPKNPHQQKLANGDQDDFLK